MESSAVCAPRQMDASRVDALQHAGLQMGRSSRMCGAHGGRAHHVESTTAPLRAESSAQETLWQGGPRAPSAAQPGAPFQ